MRSGKLFLLLAACLLLALLLSGCAQSNQEEGTPGADGVAGFWAGLWQGLILPIAFVVSLFDDGVGIYEIHNNGNWYNFGFFIGTWIVFGSILASKNKQKPWDGYKRWWD